MRALLQVRERFIVTLEILQFLGQRMAYLDLVRVIGCEVRLDVFQLLDMIFSGVCLRRAERFNQAP